MIKGDPTKIKLAAIGEYDLDHVSLLRQKYKIPGTLSFEKWNDKELCFELTKKRGLGVPKYFSLTKGKFS